MQEFHSDGWTWFEKLITIVVSILTTAAGWLLKQIHAIRDKQMEITTIVFGTENTKSLSLIARIDKLDQRVEKIETLLAKIAHKLNVETD